MALDLVSRPRSRLFLCGIDSFYYYYYYYCYSAMFVIAVTTFSCSYCSYCHGYAYDLRLQSKNPQNSYRLRGQDPSRFPYSKDLKSDCLGTRTLIAFIFPALVLHAPCLATWTLNWPSGYQLRAFPRPCPYAPLLSLRF